MEPIDDIGLGVRVHGCGGWEQSEADLFVEIGGFEEAFGNEHRLKKGKNFLARDRTVDLWLSSLAMFEGFLDFLRSRCGGERNGVGEWMYVIGEKLVSLVKIRGLELLMK